MLSVSKRGVADENTAELCALPGRAPLTLAPAFERYSLPLLLSGVKRALADEKAAERRWLPGARSCWSGWWYAPGPGCCAVSRAAAPSQGSSRVLLLAKLLLSAICVWQEAACRMAEAVCGVMCSG